MAKIIGSQKFTAKNGKTYYRVYFSWVDDAVDGVACDDTVVTESYFSSIADGSDLRVGYDRERKSRFIYKVKN